MAWRATSKRGVAALIAAAVSIIPVLALAGDTGIAQGRLAAGVNYPGLGLRYFLTDRYSLELKGQFATGIALGGLRAYRYFAPRQGIHLLAGLEADYVNFKGDRSKGSGAAGEVFVGGEYFFMRRLSAQLDFGPAFVYLPNTTDPSSVGGVEYVVNFGVNYYFGLASEGPARSTRWEVRDEPQAGPKPRLKRKPERNGTEERDPYMRKPYGY